MFVKMHGLTVTLAEIEQVYVHLMNSCLMQISCLHVMFQPRKGRALLIFRLTLDTVFRYWK